MATNIPESTKQVEDRVKIDVAREAPDSNPYIPTHWLRSLIAGYSRRIYDFYKDLSRTESRVFPDTADEETAPKWGSIYIGPANVSSKSSGKVTGTGTAGSAISSGRTLTANGNEYVTQSNAVVSDNVLSVLSITRAGSIATVVTAGDHNLASKVPVTISGADQPEYNKTDAQIVVIDTDAFTYEVDGSPPTPATGTISSSYTSVSVDVESVGFGSGVNLDLDTPLALQTPIIGIDDTFYVDFGSIGGGTDDESTEDYKSRYLDKIRNPVAHFNDADIKSKAKEVPGVTRVFVEPAGTKTGEIPVLSITRSGNVATVTTTAPHGFDDGQETSITGAIEDDYNVSNARIIVSDSTTFMYIVRNTPATPATGTINAAATMPLGQVRVFFMRDNDAASIPSASEVQTVKDRLLTIKPANTASFDLIVKAPEAVNVDYIFADLQPNTLTMQEAVSENLSQFHEEQTMIGVNVDEDAYRSAIKNTVDPVTGEKVNTFTLLSPIGDITINSGQIATKGMVTF